MRPLQLMLHEQWSQAYVWVYLNQETEDELRWWAAQATLMTIVKYASMEGWGGHLGDWVVSGEWSNAWAKRHISWLELHVVWLTLKNFLPLAWCCCGRLVRQCHDGSIHQHRGQGTVTLLVLTGTSDVDMVQGTPSSQPLFREKECPGRRSVQGEAPPPQRMVHAQGDGGANVRTVADLLCGYVCVREEPLAAEVLLIALVSDVQPVEHFDAELGTPIRVRVPTIQPHTEGIEETGCNCQPGSYWRCHFGPVNCGSVS